MFPFNHIDDECIFLKAISELSTSSDIIIGHDTESKIVNLFEINEDDSNILEYHGDLLTETWLRWSNIDAYDMDGYNHVGITRSNQHGGGF